MNEREIKTRDEKMEKELLELLRRQNANEVILIVAKTLHEHFQAIIEDLERLYEIDPKP